MAKKANEPVFPWWRKLLFILITVLCGVFIVHGVKLLDVEEVLANATILCLSCIGIG